MYEFFLWFLFFLFHHVIDINLQYIFCSLLIFNFVICMKIVELWTKRNFRCDCGNSKFPNSSCKLFADKDPKNLQNNYNQNFQGLYCTCHRPYPDPEAENQVDMIQCCACEDWFHGNHICLEPSEEVGFQETSQNSYIILLFIQTWFHD